LVVKVILRGIFSTEGVSENRGKTPKMDGENHGKPYFLMDELGGNPLFLETSTCPSVPEFSMKQKSQLKLSVD